MSVLKNAICDFCGKKKKWISSNSFHGHYCIEYIRLSRKEDAECLKEINQVIKNQKIK